MKNKIEITATVSLDDVADVLRDRLSPEELAKWVVALGDDHSDCLDYWTSLYKESKKTYDEITSDF